MDSPEQKDGAVSASGPWRRRFTRLLVVATLGLIFLGGQVKSNEAGLAVPDWPTSFGYNMFLFPVGMMQGGIFHEHFHRLMASVVGLLTVIAAGWCWLRESRLWVRNVAYLAVALVIAQGLLGAATVLLLLPDPVSIAHGVTAQLFLVVTIVLAYAHSKEREERVSTPGGSGRTPLAGASHLMFAVVFAQLLLGATMRHMEAGLAIPDFPRTAGRAMPWVDQESVVWVNTWRDEKNWESGEAVGLEPVNMAQVGIHFAHRVGAMVVFVVSTVITTLAFRIRKDWKKLWIAAHGISTVMGIQFCLGIAIILSLRVPEVASLHVVTGAALLGLSTLFVLRASALGVGASAAIGDGVGLGERVEVRGVQG